MSDFVDNEAEESDLSSEEGELSDGELKPVKRSKEVAKKKKRAVQISDDEEEDEEEGRLIFYLKFKFLIFYDCIGNKNR